MYVPSQTPTNHHFWLSWPVPRSVDVAPQLIYVWMRLLSIWPVPPLLGTVVAICGNVCWNISMEREKNGVTRWLLAVLPIVLSQSFLSTFSQTKTKCLLHILSRWMACICQTWGWCWMRSSGASLAAQCLWRQIAAVCPVCPFAGNGCCRWFTIYISQPVGMLMA